MLTRREQLLLVVPLLLVLVPFLLFPAVSGLFYSFTNYAPGQLHPRWQGVRNYAAVINEKNFQASWRNVLIYTAISVPVELAVGFALAYLLRDPFRGRGFVRIVLLLPWLVSPIANGVMWYFLFNLQEGIPNFVRSWLGLATLPSPLGSIRLALLVAIATAVWRNAPLAGFLLQPGLMIIPTDQWEYSTLEGASIFDQVRQVAFPWVRPLLLAVGMLLTGDALGAFDSILILTGGGPGSATITPALLSYQEAFQFFNWPVGATTAWFIVVAVLLVGAAYLAMSRAEAG